MAHQPDSVIEDGMLSMGHFEAAGDFADNTNNPEVHSAMTATRAFRQYSQSFVSLSNLRTTFAPFDEGSSSPTQRTPNRAPRTPQNRDGRRHPPPQNAEHEGLPYEPETGKFVYANPETSVESDRRDRLEDSFLAEQSGFDLTRYNASRPQPPEQQAA
jgi:hypothetical protein